MQIRSAEQRDSSDLLSWRNDPVTRAASISTEEVSGEDHERWFETALVNPHLVLFIAEQDEEGESVGMCRFNLDQDQSRAEVSINLNPAFRGKGLAQPILHESIVRFSQRFPHIQELTATIRAENAPSIKIFLGEGFIERCAQDGILELSLDFAR